MSNRSTKLPLDGESNAVSQMNKLKPLPGIDDVPLEEETQRPQAESGAGQSSPSESRSQMGSVMQRSQMSVISNDASVMRTVRLNPQPPLPTPTSPPDKANKVDLAMPAHSDSNSDPTVFVRTKAVSRPAVVKEPNTWLKKQTIDMTRRLPLGVQQSDVGAKKHIMHSHTGVPTRGSSGSDVKTAAPASLPLPLQSGDKLTDSNKLRKQKSDQQKKNSVAGRRKSTRRANSPDAQAIMRGPPSRRPTAQESQFVKIARNIFAPSAPELTPLPQPPPPSSSRPLPQRSKSTTALQRKDMNNEKKP